MRKSVVKALLISLIIFGIGTVLCIAGIVYGTVSRKELFENSDNKTNFEIEIGEIERNDPFPLSQIIIRAENSNIYILPTDSKSRIFLENSDKSKISYALESGVLRISDNSPYFILGFNTDGKKTYFSGFRNVFSKGFNSGTENSIYIYLNKNEKIEDLKINLGIGNVFISENDFENIIIDCSYSNISFKETNISKKAEIAVKKGDIVIENCSYIFLDTFTQSGDISIDPNGRKTLCKTSSGNICVYMQKNTDAYNIYAHSLNGKIFIDGRKHKNEWKNTTDSNENISVETQNGNIAFYNYVTSE